MLLTFVSNEASKEMKECIVPKQYNMIALEAEQTMMAAAAAAACA